MPSELYTAKNRERIRGNNFKLLHPHRTGERVTIGRRKKGDGYIYLSIELREKLGIDYRPYCYVHYRGTKLMLAFTDDAMFPGSRKVNNGQAIGIPGKLVEGSLRRAEKKCVSHHLENGNLMLDLEDL